MALAYSKPRRTISSKVVRLQPATCQRPVIPGLDSNTRALCHGLYCCSLYRNGGRGLHFLRQVTIWEEQRRETLRALTNLMHLTAGTQGNLSGAVAD